MRILKLVLPLALVCLIAAACSSESEDSVPAAPPSKAVETPGSDLTEAAEGLTAAQQEIADAIFTVMMESDERPAAATDDQIRCLGNNLAAVFSDERLDELGLNGASITATYQRSDSALLQGFAITDDEASEAVDQALSCLDWRLVVAETVVAEGLPAEQASCFASEFSDEGIRAAVESGLIAESEDGFGLFEEEALEASRACIDVRETLYQTFVQEGLSEESARCVADGLPQEMVDMMLGGGEPEDEEAAMEMMGELMALQNRCLTPDELEFMGGSGFEGVPIPEGSIGTGDCPPADGSGPAVLYFDGPQPMCLDPSRQYTAVMDTTAGEMRITLDMVNTPITANNFAVLALNHYYDNTLLFRTDPSIGIIQGGAPHTNSPSDPGPGYTIPDEGTGFTYEPGQIVMARTAAPNSASAQFFFAVNENTALLNSQGTYVVFGQMDDASLSVAEAILASHVDQPDNRLGGGPEPPVFVNSVSIEETG
ncbi:MAG: peptidylprolyl isomerase [bacterium]|nr:peptidylprolyl isomerase [bacterium]MCY3631621.1 peptidylprolyl isomerase [bacterium]